MKKHLFLILTMGTLCMRVSAQTDSCNIKLKTASSAYDQANFDEAIKLITSVLTKCTLSKEDKIQSNKLLILCYLAVDNLEAADRAAATIMKLDPNYRPDKFKDDPKLSTLFDKYKPEPVFSIGIFGGFNKPIINVINTFSIVHPDDATGLASYEAHTSFQLGAKVDYKLYKQLWLEAGFQFRKTGYTHTLDSIELETVTYEEKLSYFDIPLSLKYYFLKKSLRPYIQAGVDLSFLTGALSTTSRAGQSDLVDRTAMRNEFYLGYMGTLGCSYKIKSYVIFADVSYIYFPTQVNKEGTRYDDPVNVWKYYYIDDDFSMNNMQVNIGVSFILKYKNIKL